MALELKERDDGKIVEVYVSEKLTEADYARFVPRFEQLVRQHGKIRVLFDLTRFHGWSARALWDEIKFDLKHLNDIELLAMVGETKWQQWMTTFCTPFTTARIRYFDRARADEAHTWIQGP